MNQLLSSGKQGNRPITMQQIIVIKMKNKDGNNCVSIPKNAQRRRIQVLMNPSEASRF